MISGNRSARIAVLVVGAVLAAAGVVSGQVVTGAILGRVTDTTGAVVTGATVQIQNLDTGLSRAEQTDPEGRYLSRNLPSGSYTVTVQQSGFQTQVRRGISLSVASEVVVNVELALGSVQEKVEVTAEAPAIETTSATISGLVTPEQMRDLPLNGRSIDSLALLSPGVFVNRAHVKNAPIGQGLRISVNGGRPDANLYLIDGTVVNDVTSQGFGSAAQATLGVESILEFRMLTHNFSAEYGRNSGGVLSAVTRSGSNDFHGSIYEFVRNNIFDARNFFNPGELPAFRRNQFGAAVGGRVIRDGVFFFANYEGLRRRQGRTIIASVPDVNARRGSLPDPATGQLRQVTVNPLALPYVNLYPVPNGRNFGDGTAEFVTDFSDSATENYGMARMDFRLSDSDNVYWRYIFDPAESASARALPLFKDTSTSTNHFLVLSETHVFSGASLNEFRFAFNRTDRSRDSIPAVKLDPSLSFVPGETYGTLRFQQGGAGTLQLSDLGVDQGGLSTWTQNLFQVTETFSTVRGIHSLKFGADLQRPQLNTFVATCNRGCYDFGGLQDLLAGRSSRLQVALLSGNSSPVRGWRRILFGWFVQDDIRLRSNLTLNVGVRHEFFTSPSEVNGKSGNLRHITDAQMTPGPPFVTSKTNVSPRVGLAWDPTGSGKTSLRLGAGMFYNQVDGRTWHQDAGQNPDILKTFSVTNPSFPNALANVLPATLQPNRSFQFHLDTPTAIHYNLEVQRQLTPTLSVRAGYIGSHGYNTARQTDSNIRIPEIRPDGTKFWPVGARVINPNFADIQLIVTDSQYNYNGLQVVLQKSVLSGLRFNAAYTLSKTQSDADQIVSGQTLSTASTALDQDDLSRDYSLSAYDQRHTLVLNGVYQLPWDKRLTSRAAKAVLGGWAINGIYSFGSGLPFNILAGFNNSRNGGRSPVDRPDLVSGFSNNPINGTTTACQGIAAGQKLKTPDRWFDPCAFELPPAGTLGNLGRNTVTAPGLSSLDFTVVKTTALTEQKKLEFRVEFFNLFNHANFGLPVASLFSSNRIRTGNAGRITSTLTDNRQIQLGLKFMF